jgi:hypothetical protein
MQKSGKIEKTVGNTLGIWNGKDNHIYAALNNGNWNLAIDE